MSNEIAKKNSEILLYSSDVQCSIEIQPFPKWK